MLALERESPSAAHWSAQAYAELFSNTNPQLEDCLPWNRLAWVVENHSPDHNPSCPISGFLVARTIDTECELENIVVEENSHRKGLGQLLLNELINYARERAAEIILEVRSSNGAARALYEKMGFKLEATRKNYYPNPVEDALIYRLKLR